MLNTQVTQIQQLSQKTPKKLHKLIFANCKLKLCEISEELRISEGSVFTIWHEHLSMRKLCSKWVLRLLTVDQKQQHIASTIQSIVCNCFNAKKNSFCVNIWQWMKYRSSTSLRDQISSQLSGQQQVKAVQSDQRCKHQQARFWPLYFGMHKVFCSSITLRKEEPSIANMI